MKQLVKPVFLATTLLIASTAMAADTGWNIGASVGGSRLNISNSDCAGITCDKNDTGFKLYGGYAFAPNVGIEVAYVDLGEATFSDGTLDGSMSDSGVAAYGIGTYPINDFSLFAKAGVTSLKTTIKGSIPGLTASDSSTNTNFAWGIGAGYNFNENVTAILEWERYKGEFSDLGFHESEDVDLFSIEARYNF